MLKLAAILPLSFLLFFAACQPKSDQPATTNPFVDFDRGWNRIEPGGETICSTGTPYAFYFKPGDPSNILVYFDGGGACWAFENCNPELKSVTHTPFVIDSIDNPGLHIPGITGASWQGIFDLDHPKNPVKDYTMLMIPYCTADTHLGDTTTVYQDSDSDSTTTINHKGYVNASTAIEWLTAKINEPKQILVAGVSAGSIASPVYASLLAQQYQKATVLQLGDASGGYQSDQVGELFKRWGARNIIQAAFPNRDTSAATHESFYLWAGAENENLTLSQYNATNDEVQAFFLNQLGVSDKSINQTIFENQEFINARMPEFQYYLDTGKHHGIIIRDSFYTTSVKGTPLLVWFNDLLACRQNNDIICADCD